MRSAAGAGLLASGLLIALGLGLDWSGIPGSLYAFIPAALLSLLPIVRKAVASARSGSPFSIEMLVTIASAGAFFIDAVAEAAAVAFLFTIGEMLEGLAAAKARSGIQALASLVPQTATLIEADARRPLPAAELLPGMLVEIAPGARIPGDGVIAEGSTSIDQSPVTGESVPVARTVGDTVHAGTINGEGVIRVRVEKAAADNTIARIITLVEQAEAARSPTARFIDRFSRWYTPAITLLSLLVALVPPLLAQGDWTVWLYRALTLLLIACPCALVLSVPAAITSGLAAGARRGLLMKGGAVLEKLGSVRLVALDKTGTLTRGRPTVTTLEAADGNTGRLLTLAAAIERGSGHPLAHAIVEAAKATGLPQPLAEDVTALPGVGVEGRVKGAVIRLTSPRALPAPAILPPEIARRIRQLEEDGNTLAVLLQEGAYMGLIALRDEPRPDAAEAVAALKKMGIRPIMLTGDNARTADAIAARLGLEARGDLLPGDKLAALIALQRTGATAMVGDGINDAPALAAADVGIAMGRGTDVALETADAALLHDRIGSLPQMIRLSRATMTAIRQNVVLALGLKAVFLTTTLLGETGLWVAVLADTGGTILVTLNAMRLLRFRG